MCHYIKIRNVANIEDCKKNYSKETYDLIQKILVKEPDKRPTIDQIIQECKDILFKLKNKKIYYNKRVNKLRIYKNYSISEYTKEFNKNFGKLDEKYIISINDHEKKFHMINGERVNDYTKKMQNNEITSENIFKKKSNENIINMQNFVNLHKKYDEDELRKTITKINEEGFKIIKKRKIKRKEPYKIENNQIVDFPNIKEDNHENNFQKKNINEFENTKKNKVHIDIFFKRFKSTPKKINDNGNDRDYHIEKKENNNVEDSAYNNNYKRF